MRQKSVPVREPAEQVLKDIRRATRRHFSAEDLAFHPGRRPGQLNPIYLHLVVWDKSDLERDAAAIRSRSRRWRSSNSPTRIPEASWR